LNLKTQIFEFLEKIIFIKKFSDSISGATLDGQIATWKRHRESFDLAIDQQWRLQGPITVGTKV
jgi:hypothetical protein